MLYYKTIVVGSSGTTITYLHRPLTLADLALVHRTINPTLISRTGPRKSDAVRMTISQ